MGLSWPLLGIRVIETFRILLLSRLNNFVGIFIQEMCDRICHCGAEKQYDDRQRREPEQYQIHGVPHEVDAFRG